MMSRLSACLTGLLLAGAAALALPALAADDATPKRGGVVVIGTDGAGLTTLNSQTSTATAVLMVADIWADGLYARDRKGEKAPHLATSWEIAPDGKRYTFHLRPGLKWSDGQPFTSADVAFTLNEATKFNPFWGQVLLNVAGAETPDDNTFVMVMKNPFAAAFEALDKENFAILPKHIYANTDILQNPANRMPVGMGPYRLVKYDQGRALTFERNPYFWQAGKPYLDGLVMAVIPDTQQQVNALLRGEIDFMKLPYTQVARVKEAGARTGKVMARQVEISAPERASLDLNTTKPPFNDARVRQAMLIAMDRTRIVSDAYFGLAQLAGNAIPEQFTTLTDPSVKYSDMYAYDPARAARLLDEAGYKLVDGKRFAVELTYANSEFNRITIEPIAQILAAQWKAIGVEAKLVGLDDQLWLDKVYVKNDFEASLVSLTGRTDPTLGVDRSFRCNPKHLPYTNPTGYCNPELEALADSANAALPADRAQFYKSYIRIVARDLNEITLTNVPTFHGISTRFMGLDAQFDISFNEYPNWAEVWLKSGK
jgi:peptide/nickel transport system substrate-binding protein